MEPATCSLLHLEVFFNQTPDSVVPCVLLDNSAGIFGSYKPNVSTNLWDIDHDYNVRFFLPYFILQFFLVFLIIDSHINIETLWI